MSHYQPHVYELKVQFEDLDFGGVVHHPQYLNYLERARCDLMEARGKKFSEFLKEGMALVVADLHARFLRPALPEQTLWVVSQVQRLEKSYFILYQGIFSEKSFTQNPFQAVQEATTETGVKNLKAGNFKKIPGLIHFSEVQLVCVELKKMIPCLIPEEIRGGLEKRSH